VRIDGKTLENVAPVPRHLLDNDGYVYTMQADGKLGRQRLDVVAYQGDQAIVRNTMPVETVVVTTILQKPLVGMDIRSINMPELNPDPELAETEAPADDAELAGGGRGDQVAAGG
jgi:hypothetical protein